MKIILPLLAFLLSGCHRTAEFAGPAPAGSLECASAHALAAGYTMIDGSIDDGYLRLVQTIRSTPADARPTEPNTDIADAVLGNGTDSPVENEILAERREGTLTITVLEEREGEGDGSDAEELARSILALCTADPPVFPASADPAEPPASDSPEPL